MIRYTDMVSVDAPLLLGVRLQPLSLGHVMHLQAQDCLFVSPVKVPLLVGKSKKQCLENLHNITQELILGLTICSLSFEDFNDLMQNKLWLEDEQTFISLLEYMSRWQKAVKKILANDQINLVQTIHLFNDYLLKGYEQPDVESLNENKDDSVGTCDWVTNLVETLTSEKGMTVSQVLNQPLKLTFLQYFKIGEKHKLYHFVTPEEAELRALAVGAKA